MVFLKMQNPQHRELHNELPQHILPDRKQIRTAVLVQAHPQMKKGVRVATVPESLEV